MTKRSLATALFLALLVVGTVLALRLDQPIADAFIREDGIAETYGAVSLLVGAGFAFAAFMRSRATAPVGWDVRIKRLSYLGLALLLFVAAGEELSWGQRQLGLATPPTLQEINAQKEINLHNLYGGRGGQNGSSRAFMYFWFGFGVALPAVAAVSRRLGGRDIGRFLPIVPVWLALLFVGQQLLWKPVQADWRQNPASWNGTYRGAIGGGGPFRIETRAQVETARVTAPAGLGEVMEANVQLLLAVAAICLFLEARKPPPTREQPPRGEPARVGAGASKADD